MAAWAECTTQNWSGRSR